MIIKDNKPLLTIAMPVLNGEKYIAEALESVRNEKQYLSIELIVVDAVSSDKTLEILKQYSDVVDVLISEPDNGQSSAYNKALKIARGEYYTYLCCDDVFVRDSFKNLREVLDCGLHKWIAFNTVIISSNRVPIKFLSGINPPKWFPKTCHHFVDSPSTIWHRSVYEEVGPFDESLDYVMDVDYWYRIIKLGYSFTRYNQYVYCLRVHDGSKTQSHGYSGFRLSKKTRLTIEPNLQKASQSKYVTAKHDIAHSFSCSLAVKILKLRPSRIKDLYYRYFRNIEI